MTDMSRLTDRLALSQHRRRAQAQGLADVLHRVACDEIQERLLQVNRAFTDPVTVSGFPELWRELRPGDRQVPEDEVLDLAPGSADLVLHTMALHWADDPVGQLIQSRRALRPDGLFVGCFFGGATLIELRNAMAQAEIEVCGGLSPRIAPMTELRDAGALLQRAGFALPVADVVSLSLSYRDALHLMTDLRAMGETNALAQRHRSPCPRRLFRRAAELYPPLAGGQDGRIAATFELIFLTGWAPAESQPKPLRPGSATSRLAQALGTEEQPLPGPNVTPSD